LCSQNYFGTVVLLRKSGFCDASRGDTRGSGLENLFFRTSPAQSKWLLCKGVIYA
jgi:hypothetical protein